jgi:glycosyltransferase involved in cell wall biosynthesis
MRPTPILGERPYGKRDGRVLLVAFFDPNGISTVIESIHAWQFHSRYEVVVINLWPGDSGFLKLPASLRLSDYDAVVVHSTVSYFAHNLANLDLDLAQGFSGYDGVKVLMKQDEQVTTSRFVNIVRERKFDIVFTCVPPQEQEKVYPREVIGDCELMQVLTGYISPAMRQGDARGERDIDVSYRGSIQPLEFGRLGYEKRSVGYDVSRALTDQGLRLDISSRWEDRVLGEEWGRFLSRSRVVLGVESGSNLFDFTGEVAQWCRSYEATHSGDDPASERYYRTAHETYLHTFEDNVHYAQVSPRHFEAAAAGAAQILYEGSYSGIFRAKEHFMPLRRDLGNLAETVDFIRDEAARIRMAERAFEEIILEKRNWYESFVAEADAAIERRREAKGKLSTAKRRAPYDAESRRPVAYVLAAHNPVLDPRINWFASSLKKSHDVYVIGTYDFNVVGDGPTYETSEDGITIIRVERTKHNAAWLPSSAQMRADLCMPRALLGSLAGFAALPEGILADRIGAHGATPEALARFRGLCAYFVNINSALMEAMANMGPPDLIVAADLDTLPAASAVAAEAGSYCVFDAHEYWPYSYADFQHWEIEFWLGIERQLSRLADLRVAVSEHLAKIMTEEYGCEFLTLPNCAGLSEGEAIDLETAFARRGVSGPLKIIFLGNFAEGRGLEETLRAFVHVKSDTKLILQGRENDYRRKLMELARSLELGEDIVSFPAAVSESDLIGTAAQVDVGLIPYNPAYFGYRYCCPNKLSQYLAAGLPILSSSTEYVSSIVRREKVGCVTDIADAVAFAATIDSLSERRHELVEMGHRGRRFFEERYNWEAVVSPVLSRIEAGSKINTRRCSGIDLDWISTASTLRERHGSAAVLDTSLFGARSPAAVLRRMGDGIVTSTPPTTSDGVTTSDDGTTTVSTITKWLRRSWHLLPDSLRYALADWLRKHIG